ncbi:GGDEF domain-containing protein [Pseudohoeflea suaedae]|uniref:GGDEF domain-containing protein n=1 Tax=Pseudohoeflea suaedae TaxID=877384 RepID=UPI00130500EB|nr:GGDEF domain-containing protein [Pseudohoeflea suaedae]
MLDVATIFFCTFVCLLVAGMVMTVVWWNNKHEPGAGLWALSSYIGALAGLATALRSVIPGHFEFQVAVCNLLELAAYGIVWAGIRSFNRQKIHWHYPGAVLVAWTAGFILWEPFRTDINIVVIIQTALTVSFAFLLAWEIHNGPGNRQLPMVPIVICLLITHALARATIIPCAILWPATLVNGQADAFWFGPYMIELLVHTVATAISFVVLIKDRSEQRHRIAAETDVLTGIQNRRAFIEVTQLALANKMHDWSLAILDLDNFKAINDRHGHQTGDRMLVRFSDVVKTTIPENARFARIGGEEFAILMKTGDERLVRSLLESVRRAVEALPVNHHGRRVPLTTSIGVAATPVVGRNFDTLMGAADEAVYRAKNAGRNRVEFFEPPEAANEMAGTEKHRLRARAG